MSGVSASTLVIFIATILVAAGVAGTLVTTVGEISTSAETQGDAITESINSNIELLNDGGGSEFYVEDGADFGDEQSAQITVYARNSGSTALLKDEGELNVLINGLFISADALTISSMNGDEGSVWVEGEVIEIVIALEEPLEGSGNRLTISPRGAEESIAFNADV